MIPLRMSLMIITMGFSIWSFIKMDLKFAIITSLLMWFFYFNWLMIDISIMKKEDIENV